MIVELEKLSQSQAALTAAYKASIFLQEQGWIRYPAASWKDPAIVIMIDGACVAGVNYTADDDDLILSVNFAWCTPEHPMALTQALLRFRAKFKGGRYDRVAFTCHEGNEPMRRLVEAMSLRRHSSSYRVTL
jgi:hypothetical protein